MTVTPAYLAAAQKSNREPTIFMRVEDATGVQIDYTSSGDWNGSTELRSVDTATSVGDVTPVYLTVPTDPEDGTLQVTWSEFGPVYTGSKHVYFTTTTDIAIDTIVASLIEYPRTEGGGGSPEVRSTSFSIRTGSAVGPIIATTTAQNITYYHDYIGGAQLAYVNFPVPFPRALTFVFAAPTTLTYNTQYFITCNISGITTAEFIAGYNSDVGAVPPYLQTIYHGVSADSMRVLTSTIDMGSIPEADVDFGVSDIVPAGSSITYTVYGDNFDPPTTSRGDVTDGVQLSPYRYYQIRAVFDTNFPPVSPTLRSFTLRVATFFDLGTHMNTPSEGVIPVVKINGISALTQKIDLKKGIATTGQISVRLIWEERVSNMIATGFLKGKDVSIMSGFVGLSLGDYLPIVVGTWYDHTMDETNRTITVQIRDILKQFEKRLLPEETYNSSGVKSSVDITYNVFNVISTILDIYDRVGVRSRYIGDGYTELIAGDRSGNNWNVSRVLSDPKEANKLLDELATTAGIWLVPVGDGTIIPKVYDASEAADLTKRITESVGKFGAVAGNLKNFLTRYIARYNPNVADPKNAGDYNNGVQLINAVAEVKWSPEKGVKEFFDKWKVGRTVAATPLTAPPLALNQLNIRQDQWFTNPLFTLSVKNLPPRYIDVDVGDVIPIDGIELPVVDTVWTTGVTYASSDRVIYAGKMWESTQDGNHNENPVSETTWWQYTEIMDNGMTEDKRFLVVGRTFNPDKATVNLDLLEMPLSELGGFDSGFSSGFD